MSERFTFLLDGASVSVDADPKAPALGVLRDQLGVRGCKAGIIAIAAALSASAFLPGCTLGYVLSSGYHQAELLASRRPIDAVLAEGGLGAGEEQRLRMIPES